MSSDDSKLVERSINTIRFLAVDAIQKAESGHPGLPMGGAAMAYVLWMRYLRHNPVNPGWFDRDRFVLSAGHGSMLLYALLHLTGYDLSLADIRNFRQWESRTPGHPEYGLTPGVEVTTGPLGQGISNAVGMAIAEAYLGARYNEAGYPLVDHRTYVIAGDGDLMEGVAAEACSLAGHLRLGKLIVLYDDNRISLAGSTSLSFTEDVGKRFEAYGWQVLAVEDGNDAEAIDAALSEAGREREKPSLIRIRTVIGYGSPRKQGSYTCHGSPLGPEEVAEAKRNLKWPADKEFYIPDDVAEHMRSSVEKGMEGEAAWERLRAEYGAKFPDAAGEFDRIIAGKLPPDWDANLPRFDGDKSISTRKASESVLEALAPHMPELIGGTADLNPSTLAWVKGWGDFQPPECIDPDCQGTTGGGWDYTGRNIHFGVREHAMGAAAAGLALHGGILPFTGTFFTFSDYMRAAMRLAALMALRVIYVFSHDSIGVGEDGPTHQPVEHLMSLRVIPGMTVIRPADGAETVEAWRYAVEKSTGPVALVLTRQNVPVFDRAVFAPAEGLQRGGYILWESSQGMPEVILIGTGSELAIAVEAGKEIAAGGTAVRVVSLPSWELFDRQAPDYREHVLPPAVKRRVAVEAGIVLGWEHYVGLDGAVVGMKDFGASAPGGVLFKKFGITTEGVVETVRDLLKR